MSKPKILAYYLPAYHEIEENNQWYGKGFTEWDNTKKGRPLFKKHYQPRIPEEYYDLNNIDVVKKQMSMAKKYGVDGFIYYHYWFDENGKTVLQRPVEMMRRLKTEEKIEYCFCWANQSWKRTWGEVNVEEELLIEQKYGTEKDWNNHFDYLFDFFVDDKYLKIDGKPVLFIYKPENIPHYDMMVKKFSELAKQNGFEGIYFVRMMTEERVLDVKIDADSMVAFEPNYTIGSKMSKNIAAFWRIRTFLYWHIIRKTFISKMLCNTINYESFYNTLIKHQKMIIKNNSEAFIGGFSDWDNSPRKGRRGVIMKGTSPEKFKKKFSVLYKLALENNIKVICTFAWNEWGEGGYLEPDKKYGTKYLEAISEVKMECDS